MQNRTIAFTALWLSIHDKKEGRVNPIDGRSVLVALLGDPQRSDRNTRLCLDADDYAQDRFRYDNLASRSGEWRGTTVKVICAVHVDMWNVGRASVTGRFKVVGLPAPAQSEEG